MARISNAKQKICEHAQRLFNEKGYDQVSLREIADAAGTTIGNLTYHFPLKENLIVEIQRDLHTGFANDFYMAEQGEEVFANMLQSFHDIQSNEERNPFYFRNLVALCKDSAAVASTNEQFREKLYGYYFNCFIKLKRHGFLRTDVSDSQYASLTTVMVMITTVWIQDTSPFYDKNIPRVQISTALTDLIFPYLTGQGVHALTTFHAAPAVDI